MSVFNNILKKKRVPIKEFERLKNYFHEEIKRKDSIIKELKERNEILLKSTIRQAEKTIELNMYARNIEKKVK